jgi:hypothetical protein
MATDNSSHDVSQPSTISKKPYEKPSFRFEKVFVTSALSCGKVNPTQDTCKGFGAKVS